MVVFSYRFDTLDRIYEFQVMDLGGSFDCIVGMPWLARRRTHIDWINCTVQPRDIDVNAVLAVLDSPSSMAQHVAVVDPNYTAQSTPEVSDGPSRVMCNSATWSLSVEQWFLSQASSRSSGSGCRTVEQRLPCERNLQKPHRSKGFRYSTSMHWLPC